MKAMIRPYRQTPSARPTKIRDLPRIEESSLIAPSAAPQPQPSQRSPQRMRFRRTSSRPLPASGRRTSRRLRQAFSYICSLSALPYRIRGREPRYMRSVLRIIILSFFSSCSGRLRRHFIHERTASAVLWREPCGSCRTPVLPLSGRLSFFPLFVTCRA